MFKKDKEYIFSAGHYYQWCLDTHKWEGEEWAAMIDGARVIVSDELDEALIHVYLKMPAVDMFTGRTVVQKKEFAHLVKFEWCKEK